MASTPWPEHLPPDSTLTVVRAVEDFSWVEMLPLRIDADLERREPIGRGGMGYVDAALQRSVGRVVAVKTVRADQADPLHQGALVREGRVIGALEHPNIVPVYAMGRSEDGNPLLVMKRIQGVTWSDLLEDPDHPDWDRVRGGGADGLSAGHADRLGQSVEILVEVCRAVEFAHSKGFVHRDIKPQNVMLGHFGEVYLLDWGIAGALGDFATGGPVVGTLCYMAPEMLDGAATTRTDVYLLGGVLHLLLCGQPPHRGDALAAMGSIVSTRRRSFPDTAPAELVATCVRALSLLPESRHEDVASFREELLTWRHRRVSHHHAELAENALKTLQARLGDASGDRRVVSRAYNDGRVNIGLALEAWSDNPTARALAQRLAASIVAYELSERNPDQADACLTELEDWLEGGDVVRHRSAIAAAREKLGALRTLLRELDPAISSRERASVVAGLAVLGALLLALRLGVIRAGWLTEEVVLVRGTRTMALLTAGFAFAVVLMRAKLLANQFNRRVSGMLMLVWLATLTSHGVGLMVGVPAQTVFVFDLAVWFVCALASLLTLGGALAPLALVCGVAMVAAAVVPDATLEISSVLGVAVAGLGLRLAVQTPHNGTSR